MQLTLTYELPPTLTTQMYVCTMTGDKQSTQLERLFWICKSGNLCDNTSRNTSERSGMPILENNVVQNRGHYDLMPQEKCWYKWWLKVLQIRKINHKETLKREELISQFQLTGIFRFWWCLWPSWTTKFRIPTTRKPLEQIFGGGLRSPAGHGTIHFKFINDDDAKIYFWCPEEVGMPESARTDTAVSQKINLNEEK